jgi:predicted metal-dependent peptidase
MTQYLNDDALKAVSRARLDLVLDHPFFGSLALRLKPVIDPSCYVAWTDGIKLGINPDRFMALTEKQRIGLIAHEVLHCTNGHPWREGNRDHETWGRACDRAINHVLLQAGFELPENGELPTPEQQGQSAEMIYSALQREQQQQQCGQDGQQQQDGDDQQGGQGGGKPDAGAIRKPEAGDDGEGQGDDQNGAEGEGSAQTAGQPVDLDQLEHDWKVATVQAAAMSKSRGSLPGGAAEMIEQANRAKIDWRAELRRFMQQVAKDDYSWRRPNARYMARGLYLPALHSEQMGPVVVAIDTSGSVSNEELAAFMAETAAVVDECKPEFTVMIQADACVNRVDRFERGDQFTVPPACGRGGTDFRPVFDHVDREDLQPACLIYLTDLYGPYPTVAPDYPVMWVCTNNQQASWGDTVPLDIHR